MPEVGARPTEKAECHPCLLREPEAEVASRRVHGLDAGASERRRAALPAERHGVVALESEHQIPDEVLARVVPGGLDGLADEEHLAHVERP
jgi:hypothetical protein